MTTDTHVENWQGKHIIKLRDYKEPTTLDDVDENELRNVVERLLILKEGELIDTEDVETLLRGKGKQKEVSLLQQPLREAKKSFEKLYIEERLRENDGNVSETAKELGIERTNLHRKMRELKIGRKE